MSEAPDDLDVRVEALARVLAEHREMRWSDGTYACQGCASLYEKTADPFNLSVYSRLAYPEWLHEQYRDHIAHVLLASPEFAAVLRSERAAGWSKGAAAGHYSPLTWFALRNLNPYAETEVTPCPDHKPVQYRDGRPPWCRTCQSDNKPPSRLS